jgi:CheY-like chemotaxis protein
VRESTEPRSLAGRRAASRATVVIALLLTAGALHVAQPILVPIALAILLAFVLGPLVGALERRIGRLTAVALVIVSLWKEVLAPVGVDLEIASPELLSSEAVALAMERQAPIAVVGMLQPGGEAQLRYLCKRLRRHSPLLKIVAGSFAGRAASEPQRESLLAAGADIVVTSLFQTRDLLVPWVQLAQSTTGRPDLDAESARVA